MLENYTVYFVVKWNSGDGIKEEAGFYPAATLAEAMAHIEEYYGDDLYSVEHLELLDTSMVVMRPEVAKEIMAYNFV